MIEVPFEPRAGQVWQEVDEHLYVRIEKIEPPNIAIRSVQRTPEGWGSVAGAPLGYANPKRFNGEHGGYAFVETDSNFPREKEEKIQIR